MPHARGQDRYLARSSEKLATCRWIDDYLDVVITGAIGMGKDWGRTPLREQDRRNLLKVIEERGHLLHSAHRITRKGPSR